MAHPAEYLLWWLLPGELVGMPMPFVHPERRMQHDAGLTAFNDDLPVLYEAGIRSVVCLLNIPTDAPVYEAAGFAFTANPIPDFHPPEIEQAFAILDFIRQAPKAVAVHCHGGIGRTGTILAAYLIQQGSSVEKAVAQVRQAEPAAVETKSQIAFLFDFAREVDERNPL